MQQPQSNVVFLLVNVGGGTTWCSFWYGVGST